MDSTESDSDNTSSSTTKDVNKQSITNNNSGVDKIYICRKVWTAVECQLVLENENNIIDIINTK